MTFNLAINKHLILKLMSQKQLLELETQIREYLEDKRPVDDWERGYFAALNTILEKIKLLKSDNDNSI